jgi:hypothetical protein
MPYGYYPTMWQRWPDPTANGDGQTQTPREELPTWEALPDINTPQNPAGEASIQSMPGAPQGPPNAPSAPAPPIIPSTVKSSRATTAPTNYAPLGPSLGK